MKKCLFILLVLISFTMTGCSKNELAGEKPPEVNLNIGNENYETKLGTYCWNDRCVDTTGPVEPLKGEGPIIVNPGEKIFFLMEYEPKPNEFHLIQVSENNENEVLIEENSFSHLLKKEFIIILMACGGWMITWRCFLCICSRSKVILVH